jgi:hypothetical protein
MFLIKLKTVGNCIVPGFKDKEGKDLILYSGNTRIIDLEEDFSVEQIKKSMKYPEGGLKQLMDCNIIEKVNPNSNKYKRQQREDAKKNLENRCKDKVADKNKLDDIIQLLHTLNFNEAKEILEYKYFDNLSVLDRVLNDKTFAENMRKFSKELFDQHLNEKIEKKFVLI